MSFLVAFISPQLTEGPVTLEAQVGPQARMGAQVDLEVSSVAEMLVAGVASVRPLLCVDPLVATQRGVVGESLPAVRTDVGPLARVGAQVDLEV